MIDINELKRKIAAASKNKIDYVNNKYVSYSAFSAYETCPHSWKLLYVDKAIKRPQTIHTIFGTSIHNTIQHYLHTMYEESGVKADLINLEEYFQQEFIKLYTEAFNKSGTHFSSAVEMRSFYEEGSDILKYLKKNRKKYFSLQNEVLLGIEVPLVLTPLKTHYGVKLAAYLDVVLFDTVTNTVKIRDIKTSGYSWGKNQKSDPIKLAQVLLYKRYFSELFQISMDNIEVDFLIVKRKLYEKADFKQSRIQEFSPAQGKNKMTKTSTMFEDFIKACYHEDGTLKTEATFKKNVSDKSCKWCIFKDIASLCDKKN